jgi:hypothetical protein
MFHATQLNSHAIAGRLTAAATALVASGGSSERKNRPYAKQTTAELRSKNKGRELHEETHGCGRSWGSLGGRLGPGTRPIRPWGPVLQWGRGRLLPEALKLGNADFGNGGAAISAAPSNAGNHPASPYPSRHLARAPWTEKNQHWNGTTGQCAG